MTLPEIVLPKIVLPFDIPVLVHPIVIHFMIALPIVVLVLEILNLMMKKKAVGGVSFFLLLVTVVAAIAAYFTGLTDGKEAYDALGEAAKADLGEHKLLGTYIMLASAVVLFLKLLAMTGNKVLKALYILVLIGFVLALFKQGEEGGELVYEHGLNVEKVQSLDDELFDAKDALEDAEAKIKKISEETVKTVVAPSTDKVTDTSTIEATAEKAPLEETGVEIVNAQPIIEKSETEVKKVDMPALEEKVKVIKDTFSEALQE